VEKEGCWSPFAIAAIRLLLLTGCRRETTLPNGADHERRLLNLREAKGGRRSVHLSEGAIDVLRRVKSSSREGDRFIIRGSDPNKPYANLQDGLGRSP
jgi:hypothetical protein